MASGSDTAECMMIPAASLTSILTCSLCHGYLHNAVTITECLHTFCKGCLVRYVGVNLHCPMCRVLIHPTDPLVNIRHDATMQDILYKLLPQVEREEQERERKFYSDRGISCIPKPVYQESGPLKKKRFSRTGRWRSSASSTGSSWLAVVLVYAGISQSLKQSQEVAPLLKNYLWVPGHATIANVQNFLRKKLRLDQTVQAFLFVNNYLMHETLALNTIYEVFFCTGKDRLITLNYGILPNEDYFLDDTEALMEDDSL